MKSNDTQADEIIKCFHCGNETPMKKAGEYSWGSRNLEYSEFDFSNIYFCLDKTLRIFRTRDLNRMTRPSVQIPSVLLIFSMLPLLAQNWQ